MEKRKLSVFSIIVLVLFFVSALGLKLWQYHWPSELIMLKDEPLLVLVAKTPYQQQKGLGGRDDLGKYDGMLFLFTEPRNIGIVMRDMRFPLDIVWLKGGEVVDIAPNVPIEPGVSEAGLTHYYPRTAANMVLELPAGWTSEHALKIGDRLSVVD